MKTGAAFFCLVFLTASILQAQSPVKKAPVPDANAQAEATKLIKEIYGEQWGAAKTVAQKQALAKKLLQKGMETEKDESGRFVLFRLARDIATQANDGETAFQAIDEIDQSFLIDSIEMKAAVLTKRAGAAKKTEQHKSLSEKAIALLDQALNKDSFAVARQMVELASDEAKKASDGSLIRQVSQRSAETDELAKSYEAVKQAIATLDKIPDDSESNLIVGKYECFVKSDWEMGLPMLALGNDGQLKALAKQELEGAASSNGQVKLGDDWWKLAETQEGNSKIQIQLRAAFWYQKALPELLGLTRDKVEKRVHEIEVAVNVRNDIAKPILSKSGGKLAAAIVGLFDVEAVEKKKNIRRTLIWDFQADNSVAEKGNRIGTWEVEDDLIRIRFLDKELGQATVRLAAKGAIVGSQTNHNGEMWNYSFMRLYIAAKGEHHWIGRRQAITLWSNGRMQSPDGSATWERSGTHLLLHWGPETTDECNLSDDGTTYKGKNQKAKRTTVSGTLSWSH